MSVIKVNKLKKYFGDRLILDIEDIEIFEGEKVGLVGVNGCGKTTLLNIILNKVEADEGQIKIVDSYSYINQLEEMVEIQQDKISKELGIATEYKHYMSGGEKVKARVAKALSNNTKLIIADEPTCNLDTAAIKYIEEKFIEFKGTILLVAHDREFLDKICNKIIELEDGKITIFNGNYSSYIQQKEEHRKRQEFEYKKYIDEKQRLEEVINVKSSLRDGIRKAPKRMGNSEARLHKMGDQSAKKSMENAIKNIRSRIEKLEEKEKPKENTIIKIDIEEGKEFFSKYPIEINDISLAFDNKIILKDASFKLKRYKRVALIGDNGCGKTTLIKAILNNNESIKIANKVKIGYFQQDLKLLDLDKTILENVMEECHYDQTFVRIVLARFLFRGDSIYKKVSVLSGGERVKVSLCKVILSDNNLLILDEPTNYIDISSMEVLEEALKNSNKTMIIVSHDRRFITNVCNEVVFFENKKLTHFPYSYKEWLIKSSEPKMDKEEKDNHEKIMLIKNRLAETISLLSIEQNEEKKKMYDEIYYDLLKQLRELN